MEQKYISRRTFLMLAGTALAGSVVAACAPAATTAPGAAAPAAEDNKEFILWGLQYDPHVER